LIAEFSVVPVGKGESLSSYVAECVKIVEESGLEYRLCPMGTVVEGEYDEVMEVIGRCHARVRQMASRVLTTIRIDDREGARGVIDSKVKSVEAKVADIRKN
jgi:uncharacterized protein (TIGR00106 family)